MGAGSAAVLAAGLARADAWLPLGDGYISTAPKRGNVFVRQTRFGGGGAHREDDWIRGDRWNSDLKPTVDGSAAWPGARVDIDRAAGTPGIDRDRLRAVMQRHRPR